MKFAKLVLNRRNIILLVTLLLVVIAVPGVLRMEVTVDIEDFFMEGDTALLNQKRFEEQFGKTNFVGVLVESEDVFAKKTLEKIYAVGEALKTKVPYVESVHSITHIDEQELGEKSFSFNATGELSSSPEKHTRLLNLYLEDPSIQNHYFSENRKEALISAPISFEGHDSIPDEFQLGEMVYDVVQLYKDDTDITLTAIGTSVYAHRKLDEMMGDLNLILIIGALVALILCIIFFRSWQTVLATLLLIGLTPLMVFSVLGYMGISADSAFISVPMLLTMGVSIGNAVHINHFFKESLLRQGNRHEAVIYAIHRAWRPILFTVITTIVALFSFAFVQVRPIQWVGMVSAACIFVIYLLCMLLFPVILSFGKNTTVIAVQNKSIFTGYFNAVDKIIENHPVPVKMVFLVLTLIAVWGTSRVNIDFNAEKMMGTKLQHMKDQVKIKHSAISSNEFMDLTIITNGNSFSDSLHLYQLQALQYEINNLPLVKRTSSVVQTANKVNRMFHSGDNNYYALPRSQKDIDFLLSTLEEFKPEMLEPWVSNDYSTARVFIEMSDFSSKTIKSNIEQIEALVVAYFPDNKDHFLSGSTYQMALMNQYITTGLVNSIAIALALISLLMIVFFKSFKLGMVAMFPNVFPVLVCGGIVGFTGIPLEFVTMTVAPLILGLAVDDTIHFMSSIKTNMFKYKNYKQGINMAYTEVGVAISKTTIILIAAFLVFTVSSVQSTINMGILSSAGILSAYLADIFVVPLLIKQTRLFGNKN